LSVDPSPLPIFVNDKKSLHEAGSLQVHPIARLGLAVWTARREAIATENRLVAARLKRDFRHAAALAARGFEHLAVTGAATAVCRAAGFARRTAVRAAAGLVGKALHCEKLLFSGSESELLSAVDAGEHFVCIHETSESPRVLAICSPDPTRL
jgi:hypothetical protein